MKKKSYMPKTPKEKGLFVGAIICIVIFIPCLIFIMEGIGIIPFLIIALLAIGGGMGLAFYARKIIDARLKEEGEVEEQPKAEEPVKTKEPEQVKDEVIPEPAPVEKVVEQEPVIEPDPDPEQPAFEEEPAPVLQAEKKKSNKVVFAVVIPIVAIALVTAIAIPVTIHFVNNNNNAETDNGGKKASFNITSTTRYEETDTDRIDGYQFEPNKDYIQYRFIKHGAAYYVEWIEYGTWTFNASTGMVNAVCTTYETWDDYSSSWNNNSYSEGASNAQKAFKAINDTTMYENGNSQFVIKKVSSFTHPIVKYNGQ